MKNTHLWLNAGILILTLTGVLLLSQNGGILPYKTVTTVDMKMSNNSNEVIIKASNYKFSHKNLTVNLGQTLQIKLESEDSPHTFTIEELGINEEFTFGTNSNVEFKADKKGVYKFYCNVPGHKEEGMEGTITVI